MKVKDLLRFVCDEHKNVLDYDNLTSSACHFSPDKICVVSVKENVGAATNGMDQEIGSGFWVYHWSMYDTHELERVSSLEEASEKNTYLGIPLRSKLCSVFEVKEEKISRVESDLLPPMRFKVVTKYYVTDEDRENCDFEKLLKFKPNEVLAYKISFKLSVFFITEKQYEELLEHNLVEPVPENVEILPFSFIKWQCTSVLTKLKKSFKEFSLLEVRKAQVNMCALPNKLNLKVYACEWYENEKLRNTPNLTLLDSMSVDLRARTILHREVVKKDEFYNFFDEVESYDILLMELMEFLGKKFISTPNIFESFEELDFYSPKFWDRKNRKIEFDFDS